MDLTDPHTMDLFLQVYGVLPRAGPGGREHTLRALASVPGPPARTVLDLGCGPGAQTLDLAEALPDADIVALDILEPMVAEARRRVSQAGFDDRVRVDVGDMAAPAVDPSSLDLIWCEGAIYFLGVQTALERWRSLLTPRGSVAFTESIWLKPDRPAEIQRWWQAEYPAMTDEAGIRAAIVAAGYRTISSFPLPARAWWDDYYAPMRARISSLRANHPDDPAATEIADFADQEIDMHRRFSDHYSYGFFVVQPGGSTD